MTIRNTYAAESWDKVYSAFQQINFTSYDYDTIKESLLQYLKIYHAEHFNDFIESSELIAILEMFAYVAELLAYRVDTMAHENFITTAQRKQSILRLARLISYRASRNIPARGLVKLNSVRTSEEIFDSLGNNLSNVSIAWNDANNTNWKEQFFLVINKSLTSRFGQPSKSFQVGDVLMQLYTFNNDANSFRNGVYPFSTDSFGMEAVPIDIDENGPMERAPDLNAQFNIVYASDGKGDGSDYTGFLMFVKQGTLIRTDYSILEPAANRRVELDSININDTDVWVYRVNSSDTIIENWNRVETLNEQNLYFNDQNDTRKKYEVESLENDRIALIFGDGNLSDSPVGNFQFWTRVSQNQNLNIPKNKIVNQRLTFGYVTQSRQSHEFNCTFSLTAAIQNNAPSETTEHIRQAAPSTHYAQNRMVNGQDYNTYPLKDSTILRLKTINRTFAGQPKFIEWNDASQKYENIKLFGDDMTMFLDVGADMVETRSSSKTIIDSYVEPQLQSNAILNTLTHILATDPMSSGIITYPRRKFIEDNRTIYKDINGVFVNPYGRTLNGLPFNTDGINGSLNEKTVIQSALDQHWYGEPASYATINGTRHGVIADPVLFPTDDGKLYVTDLPRTIDGINTYPPGDVGSGLQTTPRQKYFGLRFNTFLSAFGGGDITLIGSVEGVEGYSLKTETITIEMTSDTTTFTVISNLRGKMANYSLNATDINWSAQQNKTTPFDFSISNDAQYPFAAGDIFVIDINYSAGHWVSNVRLFGSANARKANTTGWWELVPQEVITSSIEDGGTGIFVGGSDMSDSAVAPNDAPDIVQQMTFDNSSSALSWVFLVARNDSDTTGEDKSWYIYNRNMKIIAESMATKFWYNESSQIIDYATKKPVFDKIRILRSNLDELGQPLKQADIYDVVGFVYDADGINNFNRLEVLPTDTINFTQAGDTIPDNILQFENFSKDSYQYGVLENGSIRWFGCDINGSQYQIVSYDTHPFDLVSYDFYGILYSGYEYAFASGNMVGRIVSNNPTGAEPVIVRRRMVTSPISVIDSANDIYGCNIVKGLDFMWQHFSPVNHLVDPSVTNIHDAFIMTSGYYTNMMDYVKGFVSLEPQPPTPLDLRTSYGYLLKNKMLSDTVVMHSGKIKLLFGALADQKFRAKFKVVAAPNASFSSERIKSEVIAVTNSFFDIQNWDFGDKFYATELISLIHQRLATQISSVVIVPTYSVNSFGSLFTIDSGFDEILQSAASVDDVELVDALTPAVLRQIR
jgi:hypothetical protein